MKINTKLMRKVARTIRDNPKRYDQTVYCDTHSSCGTAHCIAGWACTIKNYNAGDWYNPGDWFGAAAKFLGLPDWKAYYLFGSDFEPIDCKSVYGELMKLSTEEGWRDLKQARNKCRRSSVKFGSYLDFRRSGMSHKQAMKEIPRYVA